MMQPYQKSIQESKEDPPSSSSIQVLHHVLKNVLMATTDERVHLQNGCNTKVIALSKTYVKEFHTYWKISIDTTISNIPP